MNRQKVLGILGGGQLALYLAKAARDLSYPVSIFTKDQSDPASNQADKLFIGSISEPQDLQHFLSQVDIVIFESEFVDSSMLRDLVEVTGCQFVPKLDAMECGADKWRQKQMFINLDLASPDSIVNQDYSDFSEFWLASCRKFSDGFVLKWARDGYDGHGVCIFSPDKLKNTDSEEEARDFYSKAASKGRLVYCEAYIEYERELAMVACRSEQGQMIFYPLVETKQNSGVCHIVMGPAVERKIPDRLQEQAEQACRKVAEYLGLVGSFALEFFWTGQELMVNEFAPRVHNSGHYTMDASLASQFENHIRACCGHELIKPSEKGAWGMINILGPEGGSGKAVEPLIEIEDTKIHWYGKHEVRSMRKMGHINIKVKNQKELEKRMLEVHASLSQWQTHYLVKEK